MDLEADGVLLSVAISCSIPFLHYADSSGLRVENTVRRAWWKVYNTDMGEPPKILIFLVLTVALFGFQRWYFESTRFGSPNDVIESQYDAGFDALAGEMVALRGIFTAFDDDRFLWESEDIIQTDNGVTVNRQSRVGRLTPGIRIFRPDDAEIPTGVSTLTVDDLRPGDPIIVSIVESERDSAVPTIWQIIVAR